MRNKRPTEKISSFNYVWNLGEDLISRLQNPVGLQTRSVSAMKEFLHVDVAQPIGPEPNESDRKRCHICLLEIIGTDNYKMKKQKLAKVKWLCNIPECQKPIRKNHFHVVCNQCIMKE